MSFPILKFSEVTKLITCGVAKRPEYIDTGIPFLSAKNIKNGSIIFKGYNCISEKDHNALTKHNKPQRGDILYTRVGSVGEAAIIETDEEFSIFVSLTLIKIDEEKIYNKYLKYLLNSDKFKKRAHDSLTGIGVGNLNVGTVREFPIPLPPLKTQKYIASVLEKADQLRKDCQRLEQELNQLAQSVFIEMFGDPVTNPMGWKTLNLLDVCTKITDGTHQSPEWADNGIPFLFISNIHKGNINFNTNKFITNTCYEKLTKTTKIEPNDILYTTVGSYGRVALVKESHPEFCFQRHIAHIKPDSKKILPKFLYYQLQTTGIKFFADKYAKGIAQKTLNLKDLKNFKILVPPQEKQKQQIVLMQNIHSQYEMLEQQDADYETLFNTLSQKAFKGELKAPA